MQKPIRSPGLLVTSPLAVKPWLGLSHIRLRGEPEQYIKVMLQPSQSMIQFLFQQIRLIMTI